MSITATPRRTDAQMIDLIRAQLNKEPGTRHEIGVATKIGREIMKRLLLIMEVDGDIEAFEARIGNNTSRMYCIKGTRATVAPLAISGWANTLAGFQKAALDAHTHGVVPIEVTP